MRGPCQCCCSQQSKSSVGRTLLACSTCLWMAGVVAIHSSASQDRVQAEPVLRRVGITQSRCWFARGSPNAGQRSPTRSYPTTSPHFTE